MKRTQYLLAAAVITLSLVGCGRGAPLATAAPETSLATRPPETTAAAETTQATEAPTESTVPETEPEIVAIVSKEPDRLESAPSGFTPSIVQPPDTSGKETEPPTVTAPSHAHQYSKSVTKPGCTSQGFTTYTCSCGDTYQGSFTAAVGHSWSNWVTTKEPTVSTTGLKERKCQNCSAPQTEVIPKLEAPAQPEQPEIHTHTYGLAVEVAPTCTADGCYIRRCTGCGEEERKPSYKPALGHSYSVISSVPADCSHGGSTTYQCSTCGDTYSEIVSADHTWVHHHEDAVTHTEVYVRCHCGWSAPYNGGAGIDAYMAHQNSVPPEELNSHSYYTASETVVDVPAKDWEQCSVCGTTK